MEIVGTFEAKTHLPRLLERVAQGEEFTITKHGKPVARLVAASTVNPKPDVQAAVAAMKQFRKGRTTPADSAHLLAILGTFPIIVDAETAARAWVGTMHQARDHNLSSYDASYLELAMRPGLPLATLDEKLRTAAKAVGVPHVAVP